MAEVFRDEMKDPAARGMVCVIGLSTAVVVERMAIAYALGFRRFQITLPCWGVLNDVELMTYFKDVCGSFPDASFLHYNVARSRRILTGRDYRRLIDAIPNFVATKSTFGGSAQADDLMTHSSELQHFFGEENFSQGCMHGECSLLGSLSAIAPEATWKFFEAGRKRQADRLFRHHHFFYDLVHGIFGDLLAMGRINGAYDKVIKRLGGLEEMPLRLLSPYQCFTEEQYQACKRRYLEEFNGGRLVDA